MFNVKDANGNYVCIKDEDLTDLLIEKKFCIYGLDMDAIREFLYVYEERAGKMPVNKENIRELFG